MTLRTGVRAQWPPACKLRGQNMNTRLILALVVSALSTLPAFSQQSQEPPQISVSGSAEVKVAPDEIYLRLGVETRDAALEIAKKQNDERVSRALAFLKSKGVADKDVQTDFINIEPAYDDHTSRRVEMYVVRKSIEVRLRDIKGFESILTGLLNSGVNNVHGMELRTSQLRKHRDTARAMAVRAAREKADALAAELGVKRGKVYAVNASEWGGLWSSAGGWGGRYSGGLHQNAVQNAGAPAEAAEGTLSVGQISVSASVEVSFLIE
jgi:uncharacterized protein YggE